jgi:hypothetical protein
MLRSRRPPSQTLKAVTMAVAVVPPPTTASMISAAPFSPEAACGRRRTGPTPASSSVHNSSIWSDQRWSSGSYRLLAGTTTSVISPLMRDPVS